MTKKQKDRSLTVRCSKMDVDLIHVPKVDKTFTQTDEFWILRLTLRYGIKSAVIRESTFANEGEALALYNAFKTAFE